KRFGVSVEDLIAANREKYPSLVTDPASIKVGWELLIPEQK
ncbi:TPA: LysM domain-containing protein, partial [Candidatus Bipolaricaulota bacterium]|nr:LysM domain-containing protein [Candidatus Bipolaricaulota bacterium]